MKKAYKYNILSKVRCIDCSKRLKLRLVEQKPSINRCFKCHVKHVLKSNPDAFKTVRGLPRFGKLNKRG